MKKTRRDFLKTTANSSALVALSTLTGLSSKVKAASKKALVGSSTKQSNKPSLSVHKNICIKTLMLKPRATPIFSRYSCWPENRWFLQLMFVVES